jgi:L-threonylcarbamoyladenylate synthase
VPTAYRPPFEPAPDYPLVPAARTASPTTLREAAWALRDGKLVVFPTETVYGLGANALDDEAVRRIYEAKGRPSDNPLIVHVATLEQAQRLTSHWPEAATALASRFWPGPLTLVLPKAPEVPKLVTAGLDSVALRIPSHPVAVALLREAGVPVAAPSANRAGNPSPTRVADAIADLGQQVTMYIDGGATDWGLESTVVSLMDRRPVILRVGAIPEEAIEEVVGRLGKAGRGPARSPGMKYRHYAPKATLHLASRSRLAKRFKALQAAGLRVAAIVSKEMELSGPDVRVPGSRDDGAAWARVLFATLRDLDAEGYDAIVVEEIPEEGLGAAVMERLRKAASPA